MPAISHKKTVESSDQCRANLAIQLPLLWAEVSSNSADTEFPLRDKLGLAFVGIVVIAMMLAFRKIFPDDTQRK